MINENIKTQGTVFDQGSIKTSYGRGRKNAAEWAEMIKDPDTGKVICKYCQTPVSAKIERIRVHLKKCNQKQSFSGPNPIEMEILETIYGGTSASPNVVQLPPKKKKMKLADFSNATTEHQKKQLDVFVAKFFYANNIPFNVANSKEFKAMIEVLRPGYAGPEASNLSGPLIETVAEEIDTNTKMKLQEYNSVTLLQYGWSHLRNDPFIATGMHTGQYDFLLNATDCPPGKKTSEYCTESLESAIQLCLDKYGKTVFAVCIDSEKRMNKTMHFLNEKTGLPELLTYCCSAHFINLLGEDISPKIAIQDIVDVNKFFLSNAQLTGWLRDKQGIMPLLPPCSGWHSQYDCLSTFIQNYSCYIDIVTEHFQEVPKDLTKLLDNVTLYKVAFQNLKEMASLFRALDLIQADSTNIAQAVEIWMDLLENPDLEACRDAIKRRMEEALEPFHYLANFFDPRYRGRRLTAYQDDIAEKWLIDSHPEWLARYMSYRIADPEYFPSSMFMDSFIKEFTPIKWWKIMEMKTAKKENWPAGFHQFIQSLISCPASTGSLERIFSTYGLAWPKLKEDLSAEKAEKLVKIYQFLNVEKS
ncbi:Transposase [Biomphalaria glabrata]|nr:Transposase [Biomphalaria glabrata]